MVLLARHCLSVKVLFNNWPLGEPDPKGGAKIAYADSGNEDDAIFEDVTVCVRFNLRRLGSTGESIGRIVTLLDSER